MPLLGEGGGLPQMGLLPHVCRLHQFGLGLGTTGLYLKEVMLNTILIRFAMISLCKSSVCVIEILGDKRSKDSNGEICLKDSVKIASIRFE